VPGVEGLVHISELAEHHVETPGEVVTPGEEKWVRILEIDEERRRISLSIKRAETGNTAFSDLIPDELKEQAQAAREEDAAAAQAASEPVSGGADVPDLDLSEEVFAEAPPAPVEEDTPPVEDEPAPVDEPAPPAEEPAPAGDEESAPEADEAPPADES
jgi:small subunit ribosomal protein S1